MTYTTIAVCDQCKSMKSMKECIADILTCRYICLDCYEYNTTKDVNKYVRWLHENYKTDKLNFSYFKKL